MKIYFTLILSLVLLSCATQEEKELTGGYRILSYKTGDGTTRQHLPQLYLKEYNSFLIEGDGTLMPGNWSVVDIDGNLYVDLEYDRPGSVENSGCAWIDDDTVFFSIAHPLFDTSLKEAVFFKCH